MEQTEFKVGDIDLINKVKTIDNYPKHLNPFENEVEENSNDSKRDNEKTPLLKNDINRINLEEELIELQYGNNCCCTIS